MNVDDAFEKLIDIICNNMCATAESEPADNGDANAGTVVLRNAEVLGIISKFYQTMCLVFLI